MSQLWLIDKSAYLRLGACPEVDVWLERMNRGLVQIATVTVLEMGFSARTARSWREELEQPPIGNLPRTLHTPRSELRAIEVQGLLAERGQHRAPSIPDLLIAALAEVEGLTVLHVDKDFELIAEVTGQPTERLSTT